jgi:hypothetical protein
MVMISMLLTPKSPQAEKEPLPDFSKPDEWHRVKILVGGSVKDRLNPRSSHFRFLSLDPKTQNDSTSAVCGDEILPGLLP